MIGTLKPLQPPLTTASGGRVYTGLGVPLRQWLQPLPGIAPVYSFPFSTEPSPYPPSALLTSYGVPLRTARGALLLIGRLPLPALVPILPDPQATRITWPLALRTRFGAELETMFGAPLLPGFRPFPPVRPNNRELASQEFPVDISEYIRKPLPDYTHTLPPVRPNNRELASQEFPVDAKLYVKPGLDRDWTVSQPPVRPNNRELASQEFPQDASSYTRHGPDVYSFQHGPVYVDIDGIPISALPEAWQFNRGRQPDLGFTLGPVGQDQIPEGLSDAEWPDDAWWYTKPRIEYGFTTGPTQDPGSISPEAGITDAEWPDDTWWYTRPWAQAVYEQVIYPEILIAQWLPNPSPAPPSGGSFGGISGFSMGGYGTFTAPPSIPMPRPGPLPNLKGFRNVTEVAQNVAKLEGVEFQALPPQVQQGLLEALGEVLGCVGDVFSISSISEGDMQSYKDEKQLRTVTPIAFDGLREIFRLWRAK